MPIEEEPSVAKRLLSAYLRRLREQRELTQAQAAAAANLSPFQLGRVESGENTIKVNDLNALLDVYAVPGPARPEWMERSNQSRKRTDWWDAYRRLISREFRQLLAYESQARILRNFEPSVVPGLLQTQNYARTVLRSLTPLPEPDDDSDIDIETDPGAQAEADERVDALVRLRRKRQRRFHDLERPTKAHFILDEAVLHRRVGGVGTMREQLQELKEASARPNVKVHIIRFEDGLYEHWNEPYVLLEFHLDILFPALFRESPHGDNFVKESSIAKEPAMYLSSFTRLQEMAPAERTAEVVDRAIARSE